MKRKKVLLFIMVCILGFVGLMGCQTNGQEPKQENSTEAAEVIMEEEGEEMVVAVNVDSATGELPFSSVLLNRSQFWGGLVFQGLLIANENISEDMVFLIDDITLEEKEMIRRKKHIIERILEARKEENKIL